MGRMPATAAFSYGQRGERADLSELLHRLTKRTGPKANFPLHSLPESATIINRDTIFLALEAEVKGQRPQGGTAMNKYELAVVLNAKLEDEERAAALEKVQGYIARYGGTVTNVDDWGKKRLAYEIQKMKEAFYYFIRFDAESTAPIEIESRIRIMDNVIRYLIVRQDD